MALNELVLEYKKLSQSFEEVKAKKESCANKAELVSSSDMQATLSKLATENDELRRRSEEMFNEKQRLASIIRSWTKSSAFLNKLHGAMKPTGDKSGLGYDGNDSSSAEISLQRHNLVKQRKQHILRSRKEDFVGWGILLLRSLGKASLGRELTRCWRSGGFGSRSRGTAEDLKFCTGNGQYIMNTANKHS
ncbi:hypothetical protein F511_42210 [Dorcoceras hygrometricum]|uniref:Spindle pole body component 110-like n=1 Tax=Dorcoceras hygrometricum TaxID=472368 RepID=A0A2Z7BL03_9LAMI|nr:hypothetical protein F511_42210 [Dorcoceras hygrometricum]